MRRLVPRAVGATLAVLILLEIFVILPGPAALALGGAAAWMALTGVVLARAVFGPQACPLLAWVIGPGLGFGFSVFGAFLLWALGLQNWLAILAGPWLTMAIVYAARRFGGPSLALPAMGRADFVPLALALLVVPLVTFAPYTHIRQDVGDGDAYRAYFTADFIWAMSVTNEIAKGEVPPRNPFLKDQPLRYYWMAHFLSGAVYRNVERWDVHDEQVVLVNGLMFSLAAVAFLYGMTRIAGAGPRLSLLAIVLGFLANSYEGVDMIRSILERGASFAELKDTNIDAVTRWFYKGMPVDGLQRMLLYQPHHFAGYMMSLAALWLVGFAEDVSETSVSLWAGILLAFGLLFSTFTAMVVGCAVGVVFALRLTQQGKWRSVIACAILGAVPVGVGVALTDALGYTDHRYGSLLTIGLNPTATEHLGRVLFLSFGPLLLGAVAALVRWRWLLRAGAPALALTVVAFAFYFFTDVPNSGGVWVGWRSGHLLLMAFAMMSVTALGAAWATEWSRTTVAITTAVALLLAVPTVAIDVYNAQDVTNRNPGPDFPWTLVISHAEREALDWIKTQTPEKAVVQVEPYVRGSTHWAYIPAFAERRSIAGLPGSMTPMTPYREAADTLHWGVYRARTAADAYGMAKFMGIDFLVAGPPERRAYGPGLAQIASRPDLFAPVFRNDAMTIFRVE